jgi:glutaredoxin
MNMKAHLILSCFLLLNVAAGAQQKDISVFEKKDGDKNIVVAPPDTTADENTKRTTADSTDLIVFFRPGCSRCEIFRTMLDEKCIQYTSVDMSTDDPRIPQMWKDIQIQGFNGGTIHYPIIRHHGIVIWDMIDMNAFIESLRH